MDMDIAYLIHVGVTVITFSIACNLWIELHELRQEFWKLESKLNDMQDKEE